MCHNEPQLMQPKVEAPLQLPQSGSYCAKVSLQRDTLWCIAIKGQDYDLCYGDHCEHM